MTFIAAGTALAAGIGLGSGALAVAAGTAVVAGAAGAGLGAAGAAITGGDVGKGALIGGVGGMVGGAAAPLLGAAGVGGATMGGNIAAGGIAGAAGGAAGNAAGGEDIGKGALMGGIMGGIGGAMKANPVSAAEEAGKASTALEAGSKPGMTPAKSLVDANTAAQQHLASVTDASKQLSWTSPAGGAQAGTRTWQSVGDVGNSLRAGGSHIASNPMSAVKAGAPMLIQGAMTEQDTPEKRPPVAVPSIGGAPLSPNFVAPPPITRDTVYRYYADGGEVNTQQPQQPMNKFAQLGLDMAQQQQAIQQATQQQPQAPQGIAQLQPQMYAKGGLLNDLPGSGMLKTVYGSSIGNLIAPDLGDKLFADSTPDAHEGENNTQSDFMRQVQARVQQQMQQQKQQQMQQEQRQMQQEQQYQQPVQAAANGGIMQDNLGGYSHGGIAGLTRGPGDGVSDSIPAQIGDSGKQPARLADGEFVIPARAVSELGNGSTEAGAKHLQAMVDKVQARRGKTTGKGKIAVDSKARKSLLA